VAIERQGYCSKHPQLAPARSGKLQRIVAPGCNIAYDLMVHIGLRRFLECRQCGEIRTELSSHYGIDVPVRTVSDLAQKFVAYFQIVHRESIPLLRKQMENRGGYILHIDGTCEEGSSVLLVCVDSLSEQVLESRKISSENHDEVEAVLVGVRRDWGVPLAVVHDLRQSLITSAGAVFPGVRQFVCHFHFAADVGRDILSPHVDRLRRLFRQSKVRPKLRALCRSLKRFAHIGDDGQLILECILARKSAKDLRELSRADAVNGVVHALASWILAFSHVGDGYGFPFDVPYLTLYDRILVVHRTLCRVSARWPVNKRGPMGNLKRLKEILDLVADSQYSAEFRAVVVEAKQDQRTFERLRTSLRICPRGGKKGRNEKGAPSPLSPSRHKAILLKLRRSLKTKARRGISQRACNLVVQHLEKYSDLLFGHVLTKRSGKMIVPRTNNMQESLFRTVKRQCRRLHGRGHLSRDMDNMPDPTPVMLNLNIADYCQVVYGGAEPQNIADRFSTVDPSLPTQLLKAWRREKHSNRLPRKYETLKDLPQQLMRFIKTAFNVLQKTP
jgi:hypothetical protein